VRRTGARMRFTKRQRELIPEIRSDQLFLDADFYTDKHTHL